MSTTAGVASQQYVAVNTAAVLAALLGVASMMAMFSPLLLVIPAVTIGVAIFAWRQIANSNGTETGKVLAISGLVLAVVVGGGVAAREVMAASKARADARTMGEIVERLRGALAANDYQGAYQLFAMPFRERIAPEQFRARWELVQSGEVYGRLQSAKWNGVPPVYEKIGDDDAGIIIIILHFERYENRFQFFFRKTGDQWQILSLPEIFAPEKQAR